MILSVSEPKWDPTTREWVVTYTVKDSTIGVYEQHVTTEALVAAERVKSTILSKMRKESR